MPRRRIIHFEIRFKVLLPSFCRGGCWNANPEPISTLRFLDLKWFFACDESFFFTWIGPSELVCWFVEGLFLGTGECQGLLLLALILFNLMAMTFIQSLSRFVLFEIEEVVLQYVIIVWRILIHKTFDTLSQLSNKVKEIVLVFLHFISLGWLINLFRWIRRVSLFLILKG